MSEGIDPRETLVAVASSTERKPTERKPSADRPLPWVLEGRSRRILGMRVDATRYEEAVEVLADRAEAGVPGSVCVSTVHMVMEAFDDPSFRRAVNGAELVTSDGVPLVWALRALGLPSAERVYGPDLTLALCRRAATLGIPVGFYGGSEDALDDMIERLTACHPGLSVVFRHSPPFRALSPEEDAAVVDAIRASGARLLFVGLGCPKQERWMADHRERLDCTLLGVGAAFDFLAGRKRQAPAWMQRRGLEWLFRLAIEPHRLWRRYLVGNPRFVFHFAGQLLRSRVVPTPR